MHIHDKQFKLILFILKYVFANLVQMLHIITRKALAPESFCHFLIFCFWIQMSDPVGHGISLELFSATVYSVVVYNEDDSSELISGESLAFHCAEPEGTVAHHTGSPQVWRTGPSTNQGWESDSHRAKGPCIQFPSWLVMSKHCPPYVHCICSLPDQDQVLGQVLLNDPI